MRNLCQNGSPLNSQMSGENVFWTPRGQFIFKPFTQSRYFIFPQSFFPFCLSQIVHMTNSELHWCTLLKESCLLQEFSGTSQLYCPSGRQLNLQITAIPSSTLISIPVFCLLGLKKSWFPILLPKSNSAFRDASFLMHVIITFIFLIKVYSHGSRVTLKEFLPLHPGELVMSPDWTASLKWREQAVTTGQGGTAGSALGCCLMSWPESCSPLFSCLPLLSIHPKLLETEIWMGIQMIHLKWILANQLLFYYS